MTTTIQAIEQVLKTDALGRVKTPAARREQLLDEFERSGASGRKFSQLLGLKYPTFATWVQKRRRERGSSTTATAPSSLDKVRWLEAVVEQAQNRGGANPPVLLLHLPGGVRLEIGDVKQVEVAAALLRALGKSC